jgi:hypothetical protein
MFRLCTWTMAWIALSVTALHAQDMAAAKFEKSTSTQGGYSVLFPGKPESQKKLVPSPVGELTVNFDIVPVAKNAAFIVSYNDYPDAIKQEDPTKLLEGVRDGNKGQDGSIIADEVITFGPDKLPGRKVVIKKEGGLIMKNLMVLSGTRLYQAMVVGEASIVNSPVVESKFYKSFTITK